MVETQLHREVLTRVAQSTRNISKLSPKVMTSEVRASNENSRSDQSLADNDDENDEENSRKAEQNSMLAGDNEQAMENGGYRDSPSTGLSGMPETSQNEASDAFWQSERLRAVEAERARKNEHRRMQSQNIGSHRDQTRISISNTDSEADPESDSESKSSQLKSAGNKISVSLAFLVSLLSTTVYSLFV